LRIKDTSPKRVKISPTKTGDASATGCESDSQRMQSKAKNSPGRQSLLLVLLYLSYFLKRLGKRRKINHA
jgi:hypothetical protein